MGAFIITLREGIEIALIVGLILGYLHRAGRSDLHRWVYAGVGLAILASAAGAVGFSLIGFDPENELVEGVLLAVASALVISLVVWMGRASRTVKQRVEGQLEALTALEGQTSRQGWGLLGFVFFMVAREGVEIILFLAALSLAAASDLINLVGGLTGLALAAVLGVLLVRGSLRIDLRRFFAVTGLVLIVLAGWLAFGSLHEFFEAGVLPEISALERVVDFVVQDGVSLAILVSLMGLTLIMMLPGLRRQSAAGQ